MSDLQQDGSISIVNGQVCIMDPQVRGRTAELIVPKSTELIVSINGAEVGPGEYELRSQDTVVLLPVQVEPSWGTEFRVSADRMSVRLLVNLQDGKKIHPMNGGPAARLPVQSDTVTIAAKPPSFEELLQLVKDSEYTGVIDEEAIRELTRPSGPHDNIVLRGTPVYSGKPAVCRKLLLPPISDDPLHRRMQLHSVKSGTPVAEIEAAIEPRPGCDVMGNPVPFKGSFRSVLPQFGEGVKRIDNQVIAVRSGRLVFTAHHVDVVPNVELNQTITAKDGQVFFDGDVTVYGDVEDGSLINATGVVQVKGGVFGATIVGERGVSIRGHCVKSHVYAGWGRDVVDGLIIAVETVYEHVANYFDDVNRVLDDARRKFGKSAGSQLDIIPSIVLEKYHASLPQTLATLVQQYARTNTHEAGLRLEPVIRLIRDSWAGSNLKKLTSVTISTLLDALEEYLSFIKTTLQKDTAVVEVNAVTSSVIEATGSIFVSGKGIYATRLQSGHAIEVSGYVRGGTVTAVESVSIRELGAPSAVESKVVVTNRAASINVGIRHPNTLLEVAGRLDRNTITERDVHFTL